MVKNKKIRNYLIGILIISSIIFAFYFSVIQTTFTPLSISNVDIADNGGKILIYATTGGGQALDIDFTPSKLNKFLEFKYIIF